MVRSYRESNHLIFASKSCCPLSYPNQFLPWRIRKFNLLIFQYITKCHLQVYFNDLLLKNRKLFLWIFRTIDSALGWRQKSDYLNGNRNFRYRRSRGCDSQIVKPNRFHVVFGSDMLDLGFWKGIHQCVFNAQNLWNSSHYLKELLYAILRLD